MPGTLVQEPNLNIYVGLVLQESSVPTNKRVYNGYEVAAQQKCLAHLRRHFQQVARLKQPHQLRLGQAFIELIDQAFAQHLMWRETGEASDACFLG
ncbi:MAG: hypothetical protein F6K65_36860 [Moorea sp. SIO3C2]|nr:hypothetical protein [Moorena sp. SIO3C2]